MTGNVKKKALYYGFFMWYNVGDKAGFALKTSISRLICF